MATRHELFTNCLACGKIICSQEGEGPCFFCGSMVSKESTMISPEFAELMKQDQVLAPTSVAASKATNKTKDEQKGLQEAIKHRDNLLSVGVVMN